MSKPDNLLKSYRSRQKDQGAEAAAQGIAALTRQTKAAHTALINLIKEWDRYEALDREEAEALRKALTTLWHLADAASEANLKVKAAEKKRKADVEKASAVAHKASKAFEFDLADAALFAVLDQYAGGLRRVVAGGGRVEYEIAEVKRDFISDLYHHIYTALRRGEDLDDTLRSIRAKLEARKANMTGAQADFVCKVQAAAVMARIESSQ